MNASVGPYLLCLILLSMAACSPSRAPVVDYSRDSTGARGGARVTEGVHEVRSGETLYSIAWRYGWDFRELARANDIEPPYTIYPGQKIQLDASSAAGGARASAEASPQAEKGEESSEPDEGKDATADSDNAEEGSGEQQRGLVSGKPDWQWPAEGKLVGRFDDDSMSGRGLIIAGREGSPVRAAAAGRVVYRGDDLTGYGNLLIIKHNRQWLSAYAHNKRMLVKEGKAVDAGQRIATMGASGTYRTQLHFEIRRDGEPVDPESLLPER